MCHRRQHCRSREDQVRRTKHHHFTCKLKSQVISLELQRQCDNDAHEAPTSVPSSIGCSFPTAPYPYTRTATVIIGLRAAFPAYCGSQSHLNPPGGRRPYPTIS